MLRLPIALACALIAAGAPVAAQKVAPWQGQVDALFKEWDRKDSPGCAAAIYRGGRIVHERGYGMADLEHAAPITPDTVFYAGSVSKQFTAFAAALAIQQGRLGLDDPIRKHLPELPPYADGITVRHLVHHTSGLRDFYTLLSIAGRRQDSLSTTPQYCVSPRGSTASTFVPARTISTRTPATPCSPPSSGGRPGRRSAPTRGRKSSSRSACRSAISATTRRSW